MKISSLDSIVSDLPSLPNIHCSKRTTPICVDACPPNCLELTLVDMEFLSSSFGKATRWETCHRNNHVVMLNIHLWSSLCNALRLIGCGPTCHLWIYPSKTEAKRFISKLQEPICLIYMHNRFLYDMVLQDNLVLRQMERATSQDTGTWWNEAWWDSDDLTSEASGLVTLMRLVVMVDGWEDVHWFDRSNEQWADKSWFKGSMPVPIPVAVSLSSAKLIDIWEVCKGWRAPDVYMDCRLRPFLIDRICKKIERWKQTTIYKVWNIKVDKAN